MTDEEKKEYEELKSLLYTGTISQYGKRKLIDMFEKQSKEIESLKEDNKKKSIVIIEYQDLYEKLKDKIKAKIEELEKQDRENRMSCNYLVIPVLQSLLEEE